MNLTTTPFEDFLSDVTAKNLASVTPVTLKFKDDPVVLTCAAYRTWQETPHLRWADFNTVTVQPQDQTQAELVRTYYRDRIMMDALTRGTNTAPISTFRQKLYSILNNTWEITQKEIGLLHRLPYFYAEDTALDQVILATTCASNHHPGEVVESKFTMIARILRAAAGGDVIQFWFTCQEDQAPYCLSVQGSNPLLGLVDSMVKQPQKLQANRWAKQHRGYHRHRLYYHLGNVTPL